MKREGKNTFLIGLLILFAVEVTAVFLFAFGETDERQDSVLVNEAVQTVQADWESLVGGRKEHENQTELAYVVLDMDGRVLFRTAPGLSEYGCASQRYHSRSYSWRPDCGEAYH